MFLLMIHEHENVHVRVRVHGHVHVHVARTWTRHFFPINMFIPLKKIQHEIPWGRDIEDRGLGFTFAALFAIFLLISIIDTSIYSYSRRIKMIIFQYHSQNIVIHSDGASWWMYSKGDFIREGLVFRIVYNYFYRFRRDFAVDGTTHNTTNEDPFYGQRHGHGCGYRHGNVRFSQL
jgi:hypothetical protein